MKILPRRSCKVSFWRRGNQSLKRSDIIGKPLKPGPTYSHLYPSYSHVPEIPDLQNDRAGRAGSRGYVMANKTWLCNSDATKYTPFVLTWFSKLLHRSTCLLSPQSQPQMQ